MKTSQSSTRTQLEDEESIGNLTELQIAEYKEAFQIFDKDGDGAISTKELSTIMRSLGLNPSDEDIKEIVDDIENKNNNNLIDFYTFLIIMSKKNKEVDSEEDLLDAFRVFDRENNGKIYAHELRYVLMSSGEELNEGDIEDMIREADRDHDGYIDYRKFVKIMLS